MSPPSRPDAHGTSRRRYAPRLPPQERREQLIDAALAVIVNRGYEGVSIEAIARTAGVTRPVIYDHFPHLEQLLQALIEREERYALAQLSAIVPESPRGSDLPEMFAAGMRRYLDAVASRPDTWRIILLPPEGSPATLRRHVETNRKQIQARLEGFVTWAVERSRLAADLDVEICARAILRLSEEAGRMVLLEPQTFSPERYQRFARMIMDLIWRP